MSTAYTSSSVLTSLIHILGFQDARFAPSDWSFERNPFWTTYLLTLVVFPCLFYLTWFMNPSLSKNRLGLSWVMGFYSATLFTIAGLYEVPHLRTIFNAAVDYLPAETSTSLISAPITALTIATGMGTATSVAATTVTAATAGMLGVDPYSTSTEVLDLATMSIAAAAGDICLPILKTGALALVATLPSFLRLDPASPSKYYCFSDFDSSSSRNSRRNSNSSLSHLCDTTLASEVSSTSNSGAGAGSRAGTGAIRSDNTSPSQTDSISDYSPLHHSSSSSSSSIFRTTTKNEEPISLRHRVYQGQMQRPHLVFSLENYPDDGRIGPHIIAANFQAFLVVDLILGFLHYRRQLEPFSTVVHHIIYYYIVVHMRAGDMLSVFCILGTPIEASSIFLSFGRMFPHRRTPLVERLYLACFVSTRLGYVSLLWHEVYFNYPDKSVAFLYTITISLHVYWFVLYLKTQKRFRAKQRRQQLQSVLQSLANTAKTEYVASIMVGNAKTVMGTLRDEFESKDCLKRRRVSYKRLSAPLPLSDAGHRQHYQRGQEREHGDELSQHHNYHHHERLFDESENRLSIELTEELYQRPSIIGRRERDSFAGAQVL